MPEYPSLLCDKIVQAVNFSMDLKTSNQSGSVKIDTEKLYTQHEVDRLLDKKVVGISSQSTGVNEEAVASSRKKIKDKRTIANLVKKSNRILASISTHGLPFDFFPDVINVEEERITIIKRHLLSSEIHSVDIKNISNVFINKSIIFSQLVIISKTYEENDIRISYLRTEDAVFIRRIIEGLRVFISKKIETANYTKKELVSKLIELSTTEIVT